MANKQEQQTTPSINKQLLQQRKHIDNDKQTGTANHTIHQQTTLTTKRTHIQRQTNRNKKTTPSINEQLLQQRKHIDNDKQTGTAYHTIHQQTTLTTKKTYRQRQTNRNNKPHHPSTNNSYNKENT